MRRAWVILLFSIMPAGLPSLAHALTGREVIDTAQQKNGFSTWKDRFQTATMESYDRNTLARTRELDITEQTDPRGAHRTFIEFTGPTDVKGSRFLHLSPRGEKDQQWLWAPSTRKVRRLPEAQRDENFFGTDLSYRDLELIVRIQQWNVAEATATLQPEEEIDGKPCHVVELVPKDTAEFPYSRYRLWFGKGDYLLWRVDVYDLEGRVFKRMALGRYQRMQDYATAMESTVANLPNDTHTVFKVHDARYNNGVADEVFNVANLEGGR